MSEKKEKKEVVTNEVIEKKDFQNESIENNLTELIESGNLGSFLNSLKKEAFTLNSSYLEMEEGEISRFFAAKVTSLKTKDDNDVERTVEAILLVNDEGKSVTAAQTIIVQSLRDCVPCAVELQFNGLVKMAGGHKYADFIITRLNK